MNPGEQATWHFPVSDKEGVPVTVVGPSTECGFTEVKMVLGGLYLAKDSELRPAPPQSENTK